MIQKVEMLLVDDDNDEIGRGELLLTANERHQLAELVQEISKAGPDCIPALLATLNRAS